MKTNYFKNILLLITVISIFACKNSNKSEDNNLTASKELPKITGKWLGKYFQNGENLSPDSSIEFDISSDTLIWKTHPDDTDFEVGRYGYKIVNDSLFLINDKNKIDDEFQIEHLSSSKLILNRKLRTDDRWIFEKLK